jgi:hypothetical protein
MRAESPRPGNHRTNPRSFPVATFQKRVLLSSVQRGRHNHNSSSRRHYPHFFACFASQYPSTDPQHTRVAQRPSRKSCFGASVIPGPGHGHMQVNNAPLFGRLHGLNQRISPLFEMLCRQCHRFFRREQLSFPFPTPTPGVSHTPSHSCRTQTVAFCPEPPLAHLSVTRGGGLPRSLSAVQIIVIDLEAANMQPFGSRTPFPTLSTASDGCRSLHPTLLFSRGHESVKAARARQSPPRACLYQWSADARDGVQVHCLRCGISDCAAFVLPCTSYGSGFCTEGHHLSSDIMDELHIPTASVGML